MGGARGFGSNAGKVLPRLRAVSMFVGMSEKAMAAAAAGLGVALGAPGLGWLANAGGVGGRAGRRMARG